MNRSHYLHFVATLSLAGIVGCGSSPTVSKESDPPEPAKQVKPEERSFREVTVLEKLGEASLVRGADGDEYYVSQELLRSDDDRAVGEGVTHRMMASPQLARATGDESPPEVIQMMVERVHMAHLHLGVNSGKKLIHQGASMTTFQGEHYWPALLCTHPQCPGKAANGEPYMFINPNRDKEPDCPECLKGRDLPNESVEERRDYRWNVQFHQLPEAAARMRAIDQLHRKISRRRR